MCVFVIVGDCSLNVSYILPFLLRAFTIGCCFHRSFCYIWRFFRSGTDPISLLILLLLFGRLFKTGPRLRCFISDRDEIWQDCSSSKCASYYGVRFLMWHRFSRWRPCSVCPVLTAAYIGAYAWLYFCLSGLLSNWHYINVRIHYPPAVQPCPPAILSTVPDP